MTKKQSDILNKLKNAKVLVDYNDYSWLIKNYEDLLEDMDILKSKELKKAEEEVRKGKVESWEDVRRALRL
ncbi:hypothetical protein A2625_07515 [candidate division WOR-1 bacterium RIFCSPHIGHO2_01_FULL_53_15]|uniref:Uncharacterized protein n=1 Tax=candidate division WOR-1 bacterium RIFCSPHIGHO2_01_FULL_53_15 TaxID=1802564 RepID=A0A1F4Q4S6_UNCSA|nr:MAG: hypothetical protein A2625_07515 [candidate division WOR-1 bacterium RIFCSPHIGHO2_01_FULL_53_15]OGC10580.1 MAG: hypothetical protein A3D23_01655 [candidate division WOR-1 bacterium RIFCSPHIGHO2_02_FULL_53_26]